MIFSNLWLSYCIWGRCLIVYWTGSQQTFGTRILQHSYWLEDDHNFYVGRLSGSNTPSDDIWHNEIAFAESLLINIHAPAYNTMNISSINYTQLEDIHIINLGKYKSLLPKLSGVRWIGKQDEVETFDIYRWGNFCSIDRSNQEG